MQTRILLIFAALMTITSGYAGEEKTPAFPGAEGFGRYVTGGRGGHVYHVKNLNDSGEGSLRWANSQPGPRTIVFDVSGTIYLKSSLKIANNTTLAGQTAPGDGICVADYPVTLGSNVICRYLRFRLGNRNVAYHEGDGLGSMDENNIIVDHCSVSWSIDECLSVYGGRNLTVQWCIVSQSLVNSGHSKGKHGYGGNWGGSGASFHHNLIAHHTSRTPRLGPRQGTQTDERMDMRNNVIYNFGSNGCYGGEGMKVNIVNNYYKPGPGSPTDYKGKRIAGIGIRTSEYTDHDSATPNGWDVMWHVWGKYYVTGNVNSKYDDVTKDNWTYGMYNQIDKNGNDGTYTEETKDTIRIDEPIPYMAVTTHTAENAYEQVLKYAGASLHRDALDEIIINDTRDGKATFTGAGNSSGFINSQEDVKSQIPTIWPELTQATAPKDSDGDGIPDEWEAAHNLDPNNADDGQAIASYVVSGPDGMPASTSGWQYTNLEAYLNSLVYDITSQQNENGELTGYIEEKAVPSDGNEEGKVTVAEGTVSWEFGNGTAHQDAVCEEAIKPMISETAVSTGEHLTFTGKQSVKEVSFSKIQPSVSNEATADSDNSVTLSITMADGYYFRPTKVQFLASRFGTNGGKIDVAWQNLNGWTEIESALTPERNNEGGYTTFSKAVTEIPSASGSNSLVLNIYSLANNKQIGFANIAVTGEVKKADPSGIRNVIYNRHDGKTYDLRGTEISEPYKGIYIKNHKKIIVK